ncbi:hypothetical protein C8E83_3679 [Frondihabitans australicus]|uniref:NADP-dependent oxidoreductase domain-containing protein n=2 Tax=Frondihabitans australicus TaxID=386892 RepID=A0A495IKH8_9MICO|nr:hypothetical protein C8E83_3679 [Frondihabitans australicus]
MPETPRPGGTYPLAGRDTPRIGYGAMQLAESRVREPLAVDASTRLLRRALELGVTHFDTAEFYGGGEANRRLRAAFAPYSDDVVLVSKVGAVHVEGANPPLVPAQKPAELRAQVEQNLRTLGAERLAVVNLRRVDGPPGIVAEGDQIVPLDDQLAEMIALRDEGKIDGIGLSSVSAEQIEQALPAGIACVQNLFNLVTRDDDALAVCRDNGVAWVPFFPLGSGFPGAAKVTDQPAVQEQAARLGATPAQVGLAWLLAHSPNVMLIPGTTSIEHLEENVAAGGVTLDEEAMRALDAV